MRRRLKDAVSERSDTATVRVVKVTSPVSLVTLEDPSAGSRRAQGAFCRLKPPPELSADEIASWRNVVAAKAIAVRVVPAPQSADVPDASKRAEDATETGSVREEAVSLAEETKNKAVVLLTTNILDDLGIA